MTTPPYAKRVKYQDDILLPEAGDASDQLEAVDLKEVIQRDQTETCDQIRDAIGARTSGEEDDSEEIDEEDDSPAPLSSTILVRSQNPSLQRLLDVPAPPPSNNSASPSITFNRRSKGKRKHPDDDDAENDNNNNNNDDDDDKCVVCMYHDYDQLGQFAKPFENLMKYFREQMDAAANEAILFQELEAAYNINVRKPAIRYGIRMPLMGVAKWYRHVYYCKPNPTAFLRRGIEIYQGIQDHLSKNVIVRDRVGSESVDGLALKHMQDTTLMLFKLYNAKPNQMLFYDPLFGWPGGQPADASNARPRFK